MGPIVEDTSVSLSLVHVLWLTCLPTYGEAPSTSAALSLLLRDGWYANWLICKNDDYYFAVSNGQHGWLLLEARLLDNLPKNTATQFTYFEQHFRPLHWLADKRLSELLTDDDFNVTV